MTACAFGSRAMQFVEGHASVGACTYRQCQGSVWRRRDDNHHGEAACSVCTRPALAGLPALQSDLARSLAAQGSVEARRCLRQAIKALLADEFPAMRRVETASLHRGIAGSQHSFLPVPPGANKMQQLLQVQCCSRV